MFLSLGSGSAQPFGTASQVAHNPPDLQNQYKSDKPKDPPQQHGIFAMGVFDDNRIGNDTDCQK